MTRREALATGVWAAAAFGLSLAAFLPGSLEAVDEPTQMATVDRPKLVVGSCEFYLRRAGSDTSPPKLGDRPAFELVAVNTASASAQAECTIIMNSTPRASREMRMMPRPTMLWQHKATIALAPGETRTITLETDKPLPAGNITVTLAGTNQAIVAMRFAVGAADSANQANLQPAQPLKTARQVQP